MSLPPFKFQVPAEHAPLFAYRLAVALDFRHAQGDNPRRQLSEALQRFDKTATEWVIPTELLPVFCEALEYWRAQTSDDSEAPVNKFVYALLDTARAEARRSVVDYLGKIK